MTTTLEEYERDHNYLLKVLEQTRQKLLDTTHRNRLLNYRESARDIAIIDKMADFVFEDLVLNGKSFYFDCLEEDKEEEDKDIDRSLPETRHDGGNVESHRRNNRLQTPFSEKELGRRLRRLYQDHRTMIEETGANSLFIVMGFLDWSDDENKSKAARSPLMLVPVRLTRESSLGQACYSLAFDDSVLDTNYSLVEKLKKDFDINLPEIGEEEKPEDYCRCVDGVISRRSRDGWNVVREMALGLFRFNKQVMWHDLNPNRWPDYDPLVDKKVIKRILLGPKEGEQEPGRIDKEYSQDGEDADTSAPSVKLIRDADSSQYSSLIDALRCKGGLVIEGPPGTGKSQTITNLIATALDQGLSVLFVAEKMAALDVVYKRLAESGLDPFCLQLHGLKTSKKELIDSIAYRINYRIEPIDKLSQKARQLQQAREELIAYSKVMLECVGPEELPLFDIAWKIERLRQELPDKIDELRLDTAVNIGFNDFNSTRDQLNNLGREWSQIPEDARSAWAGYLPIKYNEGNENKIVEALKASIDSLNKFTDFLFSRDANLLAPKLFEVNRILALSESSSSTLLKELPFDVDNEIVKNVVTKNALGHFQSLIKDIHGYLQSVETINQTFDYSSDQALKYARLLRLHSERLAGKVIKPSVPINSLITEIAQLQAVINHLNSLDTNCRYVLDLFNKVARTIEDFDELLTETKVLINGPAELSAHANTYHAKSSIRNHLKQATNLAEKLDNRGAKMSQFVISRIENSNELKDAKIVIENNVGNFFAIFKSEYRKAKRLVKRILSEPSQYKKTDLFVDSLNALYRLCKDREKFAGSKDFKVSLGGLFKGVDTDWKKLKSLIHFSQTLREKMGIENASKILADWDVHLDAMVDLREKVKNSLEHIKKYKETHPFPDLMWQRPTNEIASVLSPWVEKMQLATESLNQSWCRSTTTMQQAHDVAAIYQKTKSREQEIESLSSFRELLNLQWDRAATKIENLENVEMWITSTLEHPGMDISILAWLFEEGLEPNKEKFDELHRLITVYSSSWASQLTLLDRFGDIEETSWIGGASQPINGLVGKLGSAVDTISCLSLMKRWSQTSRIIENKGFSAITQHVSAGILSDSQCGKAYEYYLYKALFNQKVESDQLLSGFSPSHYQGTRDRFAKLDREIMTINAKQIAAKLVGITVPPGVGRGPVKNYSQKYLLVHEANKQRRHIPIRQLVKRAGKAIKLLKPCFLMSPLSVAQYLGRGDIHFDLVVMDEASQMRPEDALGAIARAGETNNRWRP